MELLKFENVQICERAKDWREAIRMSVRPLEEHGYVEARYKEEVIGNIELMGPYIIIADDIALPHARPEQGALNTQIGVTLFQQPVTFEGGNTARLFVTLAASDNNSHLDALVQISEKLSDEDYVQKIILSKDVHTLFQYFDS